MWKVIIANLKKNKKVTFRPRGNSMSGRIESGQLVTVVKCLPELVELDDIVLCQVHGMYYLHLVKAKNDGMFLIGNNKGKINGWTKQIFGKVIDIK